jgi:hypothetical protein
MRQLSTPHRMQDSGNSTHAPCLGPVASAAGQQRRPPKAAATAGSGGAGAGSSKGGAGEGSSSREDAIWQQLSQMADKYLFAAGEILSIPCMSHQSTADVLHVLNASQAEHALILPGQPGFGVAGWSQTCVLQL